MVKTVDAFNFLNAFRIAEQAHCGQIDKCGVSCIKHCIAVSKKVEGIDAKIVALLHDTIEDTDVTLNMLREQFSNEIVDAIDAISRRDNELYWDYIKRVKSNKLATIVKLADLEHNMSSDRYFKGSEGLMKRYAKAKEFLER